MGAHDYAPVNEALEELKKISADEQERYRALSREMALRDEVSLRNAAVMKARQEDNADILLELLTERFGPLDEAVQHRLNHATVEQLKRWTKRILRAPDLTSVFDDH